MNNKEPNVHKNYITKSHTQKDYTYVHITSTFLFFNLSRAMDENESCTYVFTKLNISNQTQIKYLLHAHRYHTNLR